jgi:hypothetical protein
MSSPTYLKRKEEEKKFMTATQIKQALISILIGAITIFLTQLLEGLLSFVKEWMTLGAGGVVASATHFKMTFRI